MTIHGSIRRGKSLAIAGFETTTTAWFLTAYSLPDPRCWLREDVQTWIRHMSEVHGLPAVDTDRFLMNGKALCLMTIEMFCQRVPLGGKMLYKDFQLRLSMAMYSWKLGTSLFNHPAELLPNTSTRTLTYFLCIEPRIIIKPETTIADQSLSDCLRPLTVKKIMLNIVLRWFDNNCCNWASVWIFFICILNFFFYSIYFHLRWHVSCVVIYDLLQNYSSVL